MERVHRRSRKRDAIWACISGTRTHPSAEWVFSQLKPQISDLSLGTVYRNIRMFLEEGTLVSVGVIDGLERFDADTSPHAHFICESCGAVLDVGEIEIPAALSGQAEAATGGCVNSCRLSFTGRCPKCATHDSCVKSH